MSMALIVDEKAMDGMSGVIFRAIEASLGPDFGNDGPHADVVDGWRKLSHAIAFGVVDHLRKAGEAAFTAEHARELFDWMAEVDRVASALRAWAAIPAAPPTDLHLLLNGQPASDGTTLDAPPASPPAVPEELIGGIR